MTNGPSSAPLKNDAATAGSGDTAFTTCTSRTVQSVNIAVSTEPKRPYLRAADRRRKLLGAAGRLFDRHGFGGITMAGVAAEAAVSRQLVYTHFSDLDALYEAFVEDRLASYRDALPDTTGMSIDDAAAASFRHLLMIAPRDRRVVRLLVADVGVAALGRVRRRFRAAELARWPSLRDGTQPAGLASTLIWTTTSALLALADAATAGDISADDAERLAVQIVRSVRPAATEARRRRP